MVRRRTTDAGFKVALGCQVSRATGITGSLDAGAPLKTSVRAKIKVSVRGRGEKFGGERQVVTGKARLKWRCKRFTKAQRGPDDR